MFPFCVVSSQGHVIIVFNELISKTVAHHYFEAVSVYSMLLLSGRKTNRFDYYACGLKGFHTGLND